MLKQLVPAWFFLGTTFLFILYFIGSLHVLQWKLIVFTELNQSATILQFVIPFV